VFFEAEKLHIRITASFGLASFPDDADNKDDVIRMADQAMYRVKNSTRDGILAAETNPPRQDPGGAVSCDLPPKPAARRTAKPAARKAPRKAPAIKATAKPAAKKSAAKKSGKKPAAPKAGKKKAAAKKSIAKKAGPKKSASKKPAKKSARRAR